jgi:hypothetical protein
MDLRAQHRKAQRLGGGAVFVGYGERFWPYAGIYNIEKVFGRKNKTKRLLKK